MPHPYRHLVPIALVCVALGTPLLAEKEDESQAPPVDTAVLLVRDPCVQKELRCWPEQTTAIAKLIDPVAQPIWVLRDFSPGETREKIAPLVRQAEKGLAAILSPVQRQRFDQLLLQQRGIDALLRPEVVRSLKLTAKQGKQIRAVNADTYAKLNALSKDSGASADDRRKREQEIRSHATKLIGAVLADDQKQSWREMLGKPFDFSQVAPTPVPAPELSGATAWINSKPLTMAGLRGRVAVVVFYTYGCINCRHNFEWYNGWQRDFAARGVTIVGVHTPETAAEHDVGSVRQKAVEAGFTFPIVVDNDKANWNAWGTHMWPSTFVIDRQGYVRYWFYGELKWGGVDAERLMRERIQQLLTEQTPTTSASQP